jgi:hypothetical protein
MPGQPVVDTYDHAYVLSKDPRIQALFAGYMGFVGQALDPATRYAMAVQLAGQGLIIDPQIDALGGDPYLIMLERSLDGFEQVYALGQSQPFSTPPGVSAPNIPAYNQTAGLIVVTLTPPGPFVNPATPVTPPVQPEPVAWVGSHIFGNLYNPSEAAITASANGTIPLPNISEGGHVYQWTVMPELLGNTYAWTQIS